MKKFLRGTVLVAVSTVSLALVSGCQPPTPSVDPPTTTAPTPTPAERTQVSVLHVVPADVVADPALDGPNGALARSIENAMGWMRSRTVTSEFPTGRALTFERDSSGRPLVTLVRSAPTNREVLALNPVFPNYAVGAIPEVQSLRSRSGYGRTLFFVYFDGTNDVPNNCGVSTYGGAIDHVGVWFLRNNSGCGAPGAGTPQAPSYADTGALHEIFHVLGAVGPGCPNFAGLGTGHIAYDTTDLMHGGSWPSAIDTNNDDYWRNGAPGPLFCPDVSKSAFVTPLPAGAEMPPFW